MMKPLILLIGKSGTGKNYLCESFKLKSIPSYTTREKRIKETDGVEHIFVDKKMWPTNFAGSSSIAAFTEYNNNYYWTTKRQIEDAENDVYIVDHDGVDTLMMYKITHTLNRDFDIIYLKTNVFKRIKNMRKRGDSFASIIKRLFVDASAFSKFEETAKDKYKARIFEV